MFLGAFYRPSTLGVEAPGLRDDIKALAAIILRLARAS